MQRSEFEKRYAENSETTVERLREVGLLPVSCYCDEACCVGWKMLTMRLVTSSNIRAVGFDPKFGTDVGTMYIEFLARPGVVYSASDVPEGLWVGIALEGAIVHGSVGKYFNTHLKSQYKFSVLKN